MYGASSSAVFVVGTTKNSWFFFKLFEAQKCNLDPQSAQNTDPGNKLFLPVAVFLRLRFLSS